LGVKAKVIYPYILIGVGCRFTNAPMVAKNIVATTKYIIIKK